MVSGPDVRANLKPEDFAHKVTFGLDQTHLMKLPAGFSAWKSYPFSSNALNISNHPLSTCIRILVQISTSLPSIDISPRPSKTDLTGLPMAALISLDAVINPPDCRSFDRKRQRQIVCYPEMIEIGPRY